MASSPGPWAADQGRRGCSWPTQQHWTAAGLPAHRCSRCPSGCFPACTGTRSETWGRARHAAAERWSRTDMAGHCRDRCRWSGTVPGWSGSSTCALSAQLSHKTEDINIRHQVTAIQKVRNNVGVNLSQSKWDKGTLCEMKSAAEEFKTTNWVCLMCPVGWGAKRMEKGTFSWLLNMSALASLVQQWKIARSRPSCAASVSNDKQQLVIYNTSSHLYMICTHKCIHMVTSPPSPSPGKLLSLRRKGHAEAKLTHTQIPNPHVGQWWCGERSKAHLENTCSVIPTVWLITPSTVTHSEWEQGEGHVWGEK